MFTFDVQTEMTKMNIEYDFVFILDCLSQKERYGYRISEDLMDYLASQGINQLQAKCENRKMVFGAFSYMEKLTQSGLRFCLQIISHGSEKGLWICDSNEVVCWNELKEFFFRLNSNMENSFIVNMSTCKGLNGIRIVDETKNDFPFFGLIGCDRDLYIDEAKIANKLFCSKLLEGKDISIIINEIQLYFQKTKSENVIYGISTQGYKIIKKHLSSEINNGTF